MGIPYPAAQNFSPITYYNTPMSTSYRVEDVILHGGGMANSCPYPYITASFTITFTRNASYSPLLQFNVTDISWTHPDELKDFSFPYRALLVIDFFLNEGETTQLFADKPATAVGSNWYNAFEMPSSISGTSINRRSYSYIRIWASGGTCKNNGSWCFGNPGDWFLLYETKVDVPPYYENGNPINGSGDLGGAYTIKYDANYGIGAPASQNRSAGSPITLTSVTPTYPIEFRYYVKPGEKTCDDYDYANTISRPFLGWQSCYSKNNKFSVDYACDGNTYDFSIRYGFSQMDGGDDILLSLPNGQHLSIYPWTSGKDPESSRYPYYYSIEQKWLNFDTLSPDVLHIGMIKSGVFTPAAPPEGSHIIMGYYSTQDAYSDYGPIYQPGDVYNPTGDLAKKDVYMLAKWGTPTVTMPEAPDYFKVVTFNYMGGTGPFPTMNVPRTIIGYRLWGYDWAPTEYPGPPLYQVGETYDIYYGSHTSEEPELCINLPGLNRDLVTTISAGLVALPGSAIMYKNTLPTPTKPGFVFDTWCYDSALTQPIANETEIPADSQGITIYARYTEIPIRQFKNTGTWQPYTPKVWRFDGTSWKLEADVYRYTNGEWRKVSGG